MRKTRKTSNNQFEDSQTSEEINKEIENGQIDIAPPAEYAGYLSESLVRELEEKKEVDIEGLDLKGNPRKIRVTRSTKFINAALLVFGHPINERILIGVKTDSGSWAYSNEFKKILLNPECTENTWYAKLHTYYR